MVAQCKASQKEAGRPKKFQYEVAWSLEWLNRENFSRTNLPGRFSRKIAQVLRKSEIWAAICPYIWHPIFEMPRAKETARKKQAKPQRGKFGERRLLPKNS